MKYMTMCGDVRIKIIPVINIEDIEMSSIAYKEVQKLVTYTFGLLDCIIEKDEMGKPFFQKHIDYDLSISHTDGILEQVLMEFTQILLTMIWQRRKVLQKMICTMRQIKTQRNYSLY